MHFKLIVAFIEQNKTDKVLKAARELGAKGATIISQARGEGIDQTKTFFGLSIEQQTDMTLLLVEEHLARGVLEIISEAAEFEKQEHEGIAFQVDVEDAVGVSHQIRELNKTIKEIV